MVKLEQIKKIDDLITCTAFVEDCKEPVEIVFRISDGSIQSSPLPKGYEWCRGHIQYSRFVFEKMVQEGKYPEKRTIMWC